jgi:radical SAM-linked protein
MNLASSIEHPESSIQNPVSRIQHPASRIRFQFAKREEVKFISHLNMLNAFTRAFRRAEIPLAYSQGFNPHPKISFGSVLPVGTTSEVETADIDLEDYMKPEEFILRSNAQLPQGLEILKAQEISLKEQPLMSQISLASYIVRVSGAISDVDSSISSILGMDHIWIERQQKRTKRPSRRSKRKAKTSSFIDIKPRIRNINLLKHTDETLDIEMVLGDSGAGKVRPEEVIRIILDGSVEDADLERILSSIKIQKTGSFIEYSGQLFSPMEITNQ